jgi:hypothetical protein
VDNIEFQLNGTLERGDLIRFQYAHSARGLTGIAIFLAGGLVVALVLGLFATSEHSSDEEHSWSEILRNAIPFIILLVFWLALIFGRPYLAGKKQYTSQQHFREPITYAFANQSFSGSSASVSWTVQWSILRRVLESQRLFLFYHGPNAAVIVPKRFFDSTQQIEVFKSFVRDHSIVTRIQSVGPLGRWL